MLANLFGGVVNQKGKGGKFLVPRLVKYVEYLPDPQWVRYNEKGQGLDTISDSPVLGRLYLFHMSMINSLLDLSEK